MKRYNLFSYNDVHMYIPYSGKFSEGEIFGKVVHLYWVNMCGSLNFGRLGLSDYFNSWKSTLMRALA